MRRIASHSGLPHLVGRSREQSLLRAQLGAASIVPSAGTPAPAPATATPTPVPPAPGPEPEPMAFVPHVTHAGEFYGADDSHFGRGTALLIEIEPGAFARAISSITIACSIGRASRPPYAFGQPMPR
jgi:hypothetical protein